MTEGLIRTTFAILFSKHLFATLPVLRGSYFARSRAEAAAIAGPETTACEGRTNMTVQMNPLLPIA
jgi:hypothetical protein